MDEFLSRVTQQAMNYAIRSGITITSGYALQQCSRLLKTRSGREREQLETLQGRLENKIRIVSPAIDMIELIAARGNTSLESAVSLTKSIRWDIQNLGNQLAQAVSLEEALRSRDAHAKHSAEKEVDLKAIVSDMKRLLDQIEDAVPLINLAITTSGASLSTSLPASVSPSRLLQASTFLTAGDSHYAATGTSTQIGPTFTLSVYMLFAGHAHRPKDEEGLRSTTWKEIIHKARLKLVRVPLDELSNIPKDSGNSFVDDESIDRHGPFSPFRDSKTFRAEGRADEFAYHLLLVEDLEDDRVHTYDDAGQVPGRFQDIELAGIREVIPIHEISKVFYADTGKILNIGADGEANNPVLLLKRDIHAPPPRRMMGREYSQAPKYYENSPSRRSEAVDDSPVESPGEGTGAVDNSINQMAKTAKTSERVWRIPPNIDLEWMALEVYTEPEESESEADEYAGERSDPKSNIQSHSRHSSEDPSLTAALSNLRLSPFPTSSPNQTRGELSMAHASLTITRSIQTSLSLLDMLVRLTSLQQFEQSSHLSIPDEFINFFLQESSTTGAAQGDSQERRRIRREARERVGFDPYAETPYKANKAQKHHEQIDEDDGIDDSISSKEPGHTSSSTFDSPSPAYGKGDSAITPVTPPSPTKPRQKVLREELTHRRVLRSSPLAQASLSLEDEEP